MFGYSGRHGFSEFLQKKKNINKKQKIANCKFFKNLMCFQLFGGAHQIWHETGVDNSFSEGLMGRLVSTLLFVFFVFSMLFSSNIFFMHTMLIECMLIENTHISRSELNKIRQSFLQKAQTHTPARLTPVWQTRWCYLDSIFMICTACISSLVYVSTILDCMANCIFT